MRRSRFTGERIIAVPREHEAGAKTADVCREHGISDATLYERKAKYGGLGGSEAAQLRALEDGVKLPHSRGVGLPRVCGHR